MALTEAEAAARLERVGPNEPIATTRRSAFRAWLAHFRNPLVLILVLASAVSAATGEVVGAAIVAGIVLLSVTLDFVQEHRADRAAAALRASVALRATVIRGGVERIVPARELVPGDLVVLAAGNVVPADGLLVEARDFHVNQALLTGEPWPVELAEGQPISMGTSVVTGSGKAEITATGQQTRFGAIGGSILARRPAGAFELGTRAFGLLVMRLTFLLVLFVLVVEFAARRPLLETLLFAVALAVGLTPELLPMVVTVTLARGAIRLSHGGVVVKRLTAIHDLGAMEVLCTDKTGTLTEAKIRLERHEDPYGEESARVLELAWLNSWFESGLRNPMDDAILAHHPLDPAAWTKIDEVPFDFERRRVAVLVEGDGKRLLVIKGAPEAVLPRCTCCEGGALDPARLRERFHQLGDEGFRVLAIAFREVGPEVTDARKAAEEPLVFAGFAAFLDPPKASAGPAVRALGASGVRTCIVTGDEERVALHVCRELGLEVDGVLTGEAIAEMGDDALAAREDQTTLFARMSPEQKTRVIRALRKRGRVVGYLGDGINDAPPLHEADVGISVDSAVDVAREAADLLLLRPDLGVLHQGVREGRRTFGNITKYVLMGTSSNFGNMVSMAGASVFLPFLPMLPVQILLNNLLYDLSEIAIPLDEVDDAFLAQPHHWDLGFVRSFMLVVGSVSSVFDALTFWLLLHFFSASPALFHTGWFVESLCTQVLVIFVIRTQGKPTASRPARWLVISSLSVVAAALLLPGIPGLSRALHFVPLPPVFYAALALLVLVYLVCVEWIKARFYRHQRHLLVRRPGRPPRERAPTVAMQGGRS